MVMTFILHPLSHYNIIIEPRARFLLSLIEDLSIDFPSHFILSFLDVYRDLTTCDKLIFSSAITRILHHFSISLPPSDLFFIMGAIDAATIRRSDAQLHPRRMQTETAVPPALAAPSTCASSSSAGGVTLKAIMAQPMCMDARLDTLSDELCQVNTCVSRITRRQVVMGGFTFASSPSPPTSEDESDDGSDSDDADEDDGVSSPSDDEMLMYLPFITRDKKGK